MKETTLKAATLQHLTNLTDRCPGWAPSGDDLIGAVEMLRDCHLGRGRVLVCGNGGSAADSEHIVGELAKKFAIPRSVPPADLEKLRALGSDQWPILARELDPGIAAIALCSHSSLGTAIVNDNDPDILYAQQVYVQGREGDVLIGISTSGNSRNVVLALQTARAFGLRTIGLTGQGGGAMAEWCDLLFPAPSKETFLIQEFHLPLYHTLCLMIEEELYGAG